MKRNIFALSILLIFFACKKQQSDKLNETLRILSDLCEKNTPETECANVKYWFIVPAQGCSGCIQKTISLYLENVVDRDDMVMVVTTNNDIKTLRYQLGFDYKEYPSLIIDKQNILSSNGTASIYPEILFYKNGIWEQFKVTPNNTNELIKLMD